MFFGCRASGEKNDVKSNIISAFALIISHVYHMCKKGARRGSARIWLFLCGISVRKTVEVLPRGVYNTNILMCVLVYLSKSGHAENGFPLRGSCHGASHARAVTDEVSAFV